jgi:hypothetical protein
MLKTIKANEDPYEAQDKLETQFAEHDDDTLKGVRSKASEALDAHEEGTHEYKAAIHVRAAANNVLQKRLKGTPEQQAQRRKEALAAESAAMDFLKKLKPGRRRRNAEQSEEPELRAACGCGGTCHECTHDHAANAAEGTEMERKQRIAALAANPHSTVRSIAVLDELTDEELDQAEAAVVEAKKVADKAAADGDALKTAEGRIKALETAAETLKTEEGFLAAAPQSIRDVVADSKATAKAKVDGLVETLKTAQTAYSEEELRAKPVAELEKLTTLLKVEAPVVDYSGRGTPRFASQKDSKTEFAPPDPYAEGIKALQGK